MKIIDYIFRTIALLLVWCLLIFLAVDGVLFMPSDWFEFALCVLFFLTGIILTITIWCGPEVTHILKRKSSGFIQSEPDEEIDRKKYVNVKSIMSFVAGAVITAFLMIYVVARILDTERGKLYSGAQKVQVIVAQTDLPSGTLLTTNSVGLKEVFKSSLGSYALSSAEFLNIKDKQLQYPVKKHEPILSIYIKETGESVE